MQTVIKLAITVAVILTAVSIGKRHPSLGGLIATMPLTSVIVLVWLHHDNAGKNEVMTAYAKGAFWGIIPSLLFFLVAFLCFSRELPLPVVLCASFGVWLVGAFIHQWLL